MSSEPEVAPIEEEAVNTSTLMEELEAETMEDLLHRESSHARAAAIENAANGLTDPNTNYYIYDFGRLDRNPKRTVLHRSAPSLKSLYRR